MEKQIQNIQGSPKNTDLRNILDKKAKEIQIDARRKAIAETIIPPSLHERYDISVDLLNAKILFSKK